MIKTLEPQADEDDIRSWMMAATLRIWAGNHLCSESYLEILPLFHEKTYSLAQVVTALDCAGEPSRTLRIPDFFRKIAEGDAARGSSHSRSLVDCIGRFLQQLALVNGDFTMEEAAALRQIMELLLRYCDSQKVPAGAELEYHPEMITPLSQIGYYQENLDESHSPSGGSGEPASSGVTADGGERRQDAPENSFARNPVHPEAPEPDPALEPSRAGSSARRESALPSAAQPAGQGETLEDVLAELNSLIGLAHVKSDIQSLLNFIRICRMRTERNMKVPSISYHLVFTGNPGTGKTTVARMVAKLYYLMGILPQGQLVETDRSGLVAGYLGQTAIKTQGVIQEALGGVLFIDEAYSLVNDKEDSFGKEAIETILKAMEDHRDELVVIVAGYDGPMQDFIQANPGLRSRFNKFFHFPDYNGEELLAILRHFCDVNGYTLAADAVPVLAQQMDQMTRCKEEHFGNARAIRNLFEHAINHQADRLVLDSEITDEELTELTLADFQPDLGV